MSCSYSITRDSIRVKSDRLKSLFALNDLASMKLVASNNCCSDHTRNFKFCKPSESCNYRIRYCTDYATHLEDRAPANKVITLNLNHFCDEGIFVTGFVRNLQNQPVADCPIDIWYDGEIHQAVTDGNGDFYFVIENITNGVYNIEIRAPHARSVRQSYSITDCLGVEVHQPATFEYICDDSYFTKTNELILTISGVDKNILRKEYNFLEESQRLQFVNDVNNWFRSNCSGASICMDYVNDEGSICYDFQIKNLPNHIVPKNIILYGAGNCIGRPEFQCTNAESVDLCEDDEATKCGVFVARVDMECGIYRFVFMKLKNRNCVESFIYFNDGDIPYTQHNECGIGQTNLSAIRDKITEWLEDQELEGTVDVSITNGLFEIKITNMTVGASPMTLFYDDQNSGQRKQVEFTCIDYDYSLNDCEWTARVETEDECGPREIGIVTRKLVGTNVPEIAVSLNVGGPEYNNEDSGVYITQKIAEYFPGSFVTFSREDGYSEDSVLVIKVNHSPSRPKSIISYDVNGNAIENLFSCSNLYHACECEDGESDHVGFTDDELIIFPELFGKSSFTHGVYTISVCYRTFTGEQYSENHCLFYETQEIRCLVSDAVAKKIDTVAPALYESLKHYQACKNCDCDNMCEIYEALINELNDVFGKRVANGCGC